MITPRSSTRYVSPLMRPIPIGCRSDTTTSTVDGSERRRAASRTQGDASSLARQRSRSVQIRLSPRRPFSTPSTSPLDSRSVPRTTMRSTCSTCACAAALDAQYTPYASRTPSAPDSSSGLMSERQLRFLRAGLTCPRWKRRSAGAATALTDDPHRADPARPLRVGRQGPRQGSEGRSSLRPRGPSGASLPGPEARRRAGPARCQSTRRQA